MKKKLSLTKRSTSKSIVGRKIENSEKFEESFLEESPVKPRIIFAARPKSAARARREVEKRPPVKLSRNTNKKSMHNISLLLLQRLEAGGAQCGGKSHKAARRPIKNLSKSQVLPVRRHHYSPPCDKSKSPLTPKGEIEGRGGKLFYNQSRGSEYTTQLRRRPRLTFTDVNSPSNINLKRDFGFLKTTAQKLGENFRLERLRAESKKKREENEEGRKQIKKAQSLRNQMIREMNARRVSRSRAHFTASKPSILHTAVRISHHGSRQKQGLTEIARRTMLGLNFLDLRAKLSLKHIQSPVRLQKKEDKSERPAMEGQKRNRKNLSHKSLSFYLTRRSKFELEKEIREQIEQQKRLRISQNMSKLQELLKIIVNFFVF